MNQDFSDNYRKSLDFGVVKSNVVKAVLGGQVPTLSRRHLDANLALGDCVQEHSSWILTFVSDTLRVRCAERIVSLPHTLTLSHSSTTHSHSHTLTPACLLAC